MIYPVISIRQPWAWAILNAGKDVENRTWCLPRQYVNTPVLIHAGKNVDKDAVDFLACIGLMMFEQPMPDTYQTGGIVGALIFQGEGTNRFSSWREEGLNHWAIERAWPVPFHPCKGQLGFFRVDYPHDIKALA